MGRKNFTKEQEDWIKLHYNDFETTGSFIDAYNEMFSENRSVSVMKHKCNSLGLYRYQFFTKEQEEWLSTQYRNCSSLDSLTDLYNKVFSENRSVNAINYKCNNLGLCKSRYYTKEMNQWLIKNIRKVPFKELVIRFNKIFNTNRSIHSIRIHCNRNLKIYSSDQRRGITRRAQLPIGTERSRKGDKYIRVKVSDEVGGYSSNWKVKQQVVWEEHHGKLPEGKVVVFLNQNKRDFSIENLYAINKKLHSLMIKNDWYSQNREVTLSAIKWCELYYAAREDVSIK